MKKTTEKPLGGEKLVETIFNALKDALAEDITVIDLRNHQGPADWFIVCQADNTVHTRSCADRVFDNLLDCGTRPWQQEGMENGRWILMDYSDVVVHVMLPDLRSYYRLEDLWTDMPKK